MKVRLVLCLAACLVGLTAQDLVPRPLKLEKGEGQFTIRAGARIIAVGDAVTEARKLRDYLRPATGYEMPIQSEGKGAITLALDPGAQALGPEGYQLQVTQDGIQIKALKPTGLFYGIQSLRQLLPAAILRKARVEGVPWSVPMVRIEDSPRFGWRGSHLDTGRHFMPKGFILKHLELMAQHKLNTFHWHLTEDQGWRIEIKKYPRLTQVGAWRKETCVGGWRSDPSQYTFDGKPHGGFYTQEDIREVVAYAASLHIQVVPEIEMPGHARAAIAAYPELGNFPEAKTEVATFWGIHTVVFGVQDKTLAFLKDVLDEVMALFPGTFIHIGGDECPKLEWAQSPIALARMRELKLIDEKTTSADLLKEKDWHGPTHPALKKLQSWFIGQMDAYLASKGRRLLGWDEILEGGLAPGAAVMSWRGEAGGIEAANAGHDVVMAPNTYTYLDYDQAKAQDPGFREPFKIGPYCGLEVVYGYDPIPAGITADQKKHVLGSQGQLWTEFMPDPGQVEYMAWPRLAALSEVLWSPKEGKDYKDFQNRLPQDLKRLDAQDVNYRPAGGPRWPY